MARKFTATHHERPAARTSWDPLAEWYSGMVGEGGHKFHRNVAIPALLDMLRLRPGERVLDVGCGTGVLAPAVAEAGAQYIGVDASPRLLAVAREQHGRDGRFLLGDARALSAQRELQAGAFEAVTFLLSIQDMDPLGQVIEAAAWALRDGGHIAILMTHPAFRVPRQSGWGWDEGRKLRYRRVDRYLTPLPVPLKPYPGEQGVSRSFHRPLEMYVNTLAAHGLLLDQMRELPTYEVSRSAEASAENLANKEIPLFLALRARKVAA